ncbi:MAG: hypothetical protein AAF511_05620 [Pseudomonadota bacterium]
MTMPGPYHSSTPLTAPFDWKAYARHLDGLDLTDDQKAQLVQEMMAVMVAFVDLGFGVGSGDKPGDSGGDDSPFMPQADEAVLDLKRIPATDSTRDDAPATKEGG